MYNFHRGNKKFGGDRENRRPAFDRSDRQMHRTTCSKCGADCEVPFKPTGVRPVFCSKCFEHSRGSESKRYDDRDSSARFENKNTDREGNSNEHLKKQLETLNWKLDKILKLLTSAVTPVIKKEVKIEKVIEELINKKPAKVPKKNKPKVKTSVPV